MWKAALATAVLLGISAAALVYWRKSPYLLVGWLWYLGMLVPVIGLAQVGVHAMADRYTYLPQIGLCMALAWLTEDFCCRYLYRCSVGKLGIVPALAVSALIGCAWRQTMFWQDSESLWTHTLACTSQNFIAHYNLGNDLADRGHLDEAILNYRRALNVKPDYHAARNNLGNQLLQTGKIEEAIGEYRRVLAASPYYFQAHCNLGIALATQGRSDEAIAEYRKALQIRPDSVEAHSTLGIALFDLGRLDEAVAHFRRVLEIKPGYDGVRHILSVALSRREEILAALAQRRDRLRLNPNDVTLLNDTAWLLATNPNVSIRNGQQAVELAQRAVDLSGGQEPAILSTLAAACAEAGRFPEAVPTARKALELAKRQNKPALAESIQAKLSLYEAGTPFRETLRPSAGTPSAD
jgi:Flp pilus assembly protein TadD